ncbi:lipase family protein [Williamsia serinedens]|uniref:Secretory lipase n=1 Tax=Williamsia serinedens TaxID=391736 RepID=A0ABT1H668_9NOCA|nr:lipase family protein [Williamsia serinedens]MCP2162724.1 Secretory lipase [Williamsia serinedens]
MSSRRASRRRTTLALLTAATVVTALSACATGEPAPPPGDTPSVTSFAPLFGGSATVPAPNLGGSAPGSLVSVKPLEGNEQLEDVDARVERVVYRSTSGVDGSRTEVSGVIAIPPGTPPPGGWPVIAFGHGTTGVLDKCAPSDFSTLVGNGSMMASMIQSGFAVTLPDFQGLGVRGYLNPFLDGATYGNNMIDSVRAARNLDPTGVSTNWTAFGHSLGGLAAWGAADRDAAYGGGLSLKGTMAMAPPADMSGLADKAQAGTLTGDQRVALIFALQSLSWTNPTLDLNRYRTPSLASKWNLLLDCTAPLDEVLKTRETVTNADLKPDTQADTDRLRTLLEQWAVPKNPVTGPMLLMFGTKDELVDWQWTQAAADKACRIGGFIEIDKRMGEGHGDLESDRGLPWLKDRIAGQTANNTCPPRT